MKLKLSNPYYHIVFWLVVVSLLTLVFSQSWGSGINTFFFIIMLLPVVMGTSYLFNFFLVPKYLLSKKYGWFSLYFFYLLVISLYLQMWILMFSFIYLANFNLADLGPNSTDDVVLLAIVMYMIVFAGSFLITVQQLSEHQKQIDRFMDEKKKNEQAVLELVSNRQVVRIPHNDILFIESLSDYIQVHCEKLGKVTSKEKISAIDETLPERFVRIHRSFVVNANKVTKVTANEVYLNDIRLNIGRTYKKEVADILKTN